MFDDADGDGAGASCKENADDIPERSRLVLALPVEVDQPNDAGNKAQERKGYVQLSPLAIDFAYATV
jgi:hypothetical protein